MIYMIDPINITITHALGWINKDKYANCSGSHRRQAPNATEEKKGSFESPQNNSAKTPASLNVLRFKTGVKNHGLFELVPPE